jgi:hypothetical protein
MRRIILNIIFILMVYMNAHSQINPSINQINTSASPASMTTVSIGIGALIYLINPIVLYDDKKVYMGVTKELSLGFGKFGEHRFAFEYSFVFTGNVSNHFRLSYKYDLLFKDKIEPSHMLQGTSVLSVGAGGFTNLSKQGVFPEVTFGYSLRNHKLLIYPHVKIRHTFMFRKIDSDITDISFGLILGFANPFNKVVIKRNYY